MDDEVVALFKERPRVVLVPNLPGRGVAEDLSWIGDTVGAGELAELQARYAAGHPPGPPLTATIARLPTHPVAHHRRGNTQIRG